MKNISLIVSHFYPENTAATNRLVSLANSLAKDYHLTVFTLTEKGAKNERQKVSYNGYDVYYLNQKDYNSLNYFSKFVNELLFTAKLCLLSRSVNADIVLTSSPFMLLVFNVMFFAKAKKKVLDIRDLTWTYLPENGFTQRLIKYIFNSLAKAAVPKYDLITVTNTREYSWIHQNTRAKNVHIVANGVELEKFNILSRIEYQPNNNSDKKVISYIGNLGVGQNILSVVKMIGSFENLEFQIIGDGNQLEEIIQYIQKNNLSNIKIIGKIEWKHLPFYYSKTDYLFAQLDRNYKTAIPSKLYEYISTGLPIIFNGEGVASDFLQSFENTFCVTSKKELRKVLQQVNSNNAPPFSAKNIYKISDNYLREHQNKKFISLLKTLL